MSVHDEGQFQKHAVHTELYIYVFITLVIFFYSECHRNIKFKITYAISAYHH
jgi:hypothetical protein